MHSRFVEIRGFEGRYAVSDLGEVLSLDRVVEGPRGPQKVRGRTLRAKTDRYGYLTVNLAREGHTETRKVHRLVADAFLPNPEGLPEVNHRNEDKACNDALNLEWCDTAYNVCYGTAIARSADTRARPYRLCSPEGLVVSGENVNILAAELGLSARCLRKVMAGARTTHRGWRLP